MLSSFHFSALFLHFQRSADLRYYRPPHYCTHSYSLHTRVCPVLITLPRSLYQSVPHVYQQLLTTRAALVVMACCRALCISQSDYLNSEGCGETNIAASNFPIAVFAIMRSCRKLKRKKRYRNRDRYTRLYIS